MVEPISAQDFTAVYCVKCLYEFFWWLPAIKYRVVMTPDSAILWREESKFQILFVFTHDYIKMFKFSLFLITVVVGENSENYGESYDRDYESAYSDPLQRLFI